MHDLPLSAPYQLRVQRDDDDGFAAALYSATRGDLRQVPAAHAVIGWRCVPSCSLALEGLRLHAGQGQVLRLQLSDKEAYRRTRWRPCDR